ncbi:hypothetical protein AAG906_019574 [Vitis piasezkii]
MCGGDDHLAWKRPVSSEACRGLRTAGGAFGASLIIVGIQYSLFYISSMFSLCLPYLVLHALQDWFFILSVDLPSWRIWQLRVSDSSSAWDDLDSILVASLPAKRWLSTYSSSTLQCDEGPWVRRSHDDHHVSFISSGA